MWGGEDGEWMLSEVLLRNGWECCYICESQKGIANEDLGRGAFGSLHSIAMPSQDSNKMLNEQ